MTQSNHKNPAHNIPNEDDQSSESTQNHKKDKILGAGEHLPKNHSQGPIDNEWPIGQPLKDNPEYQVIDILGRGGFGITYLVTNQAGKKFAIKKLKEYQPNDPDSKKIKKDFLQESKTLVKCDHCHIISLEDIIFENNLPCIVTTYIEGPNLAQLVDRQDLSEMEAIYYIQQIAQALIYLHQNKWLHRDVKPENIIIKADENKAVLIDFGTARKFRSDSKPTTFESKYFTPIEQKEGGREGPYTDVYALASTLYFILTKERPQDVLKRREKQRNKELDPLAPPRDYNNKISQQTEYAILEGMALEPDDRPQSIQQWLRLLPAVPLTNNLTVIPPIQEENLDISVNPNQKTKINLIGILGKTALINSGLLLILDALIFSSKLLPNSGLAVLLGIFLITIAMINNRLSLEDTIYQFIIAFIPALGVLVTLSQQSQQTNLSLLTQGIWCLISVIISVVLMWIFQKFITPI